MNAQTRMTEVFKAVVGREIDRLGKAADGYRAVAAKAELGYDYVYQIYTGKPVSKPKQPSLEAMSALTRAYADEEAFADIFSGSPNYLQPSRGEVQETTEYLPGFEKLHIPVLAQAGSMGLGAEQLHDEVVIGRLTVSPEWALKTLKPSKLENLRFIHGYGDSMDPTFSDGDILLVDSGMLDPDIDGVYVLEANGRIYIKRVRQRMDGKYEVSSDNPTVKTADVLDGSHQLNVRGRVIWCWNGKKL
jgi:hypothetical protein